MKLSLKIWSIRFSSALPLMVKCKNYVSMETVIREMCCGKNETPNFVDFDDTMTGPAIQDLWMMLSGDRNQRQAQLLELGRRL